MHSTVVRGVVSSNLTEETYIGVIISHPIKIKEMDNLANKLEKQNKMRFLVSDLFKRKETRRFVC